MALSGYTRRALAIAMGSQAAGDAVLTVIDADGGTVDANIKERLYQAIANRNAGTQVGAAIDADGALDGYESHYLRHLLGQQAFTEIDAEQGA